MTTPLVKQIASIVKRELPKAGATESATLHRVTAGTRTAGSLIDGTHPTESDLPCKDFVSTTKRERIGGTLVGTGDRIVVLIGLGTVEPRAKDAITIDSTRQRIVSIEGNAAAWTCLCRR